MGIREKALKMKAVAPHIAATDADIRNLALETIAGSLEANKSEIFEANERDMEAAENKNISEPILKRLKFDEDKLNDVISGIKSLISLEDPLNRKVLSRELDKDLTLYKETCPIGVIGVIFEARPDAMVQVSTLCIKSGNCAVLKGGSEALNTNRKLFHMISEAAFSSGIPEGSLMLAETHDDIDKLLECDDAIDLLIPRGSNEFVKYIMDNTRIPVMGHADGICHIYVDKNADIKKAVSIIIDAKTQYPAACNSVETLLIHNDIADSLVPSLAEALKNGNVEFRGTAGIKNIVDCLDADEADFETEYLDHIISAKIVKDIDEAIDHINHYGSHHTDAIITEDKKAAEIFMKLVDSAGVYQNCSTRFADGFRYGFGAEVGISTSKLHARGPVGLDGLVTYKYKLFGNGHIVRDYAEGKRIFDFKDI